MKKLFSLFTCMVLSTFLYAQPVKAQPAIDVVAKLEECSKIELRADRLLCFDGLTERLGIISEDMMDKRETVVDKAGFWSVAKRNSSTGGEIIYLRNDSMQPINSGTSGSWSPTIVVECLHGNTDVYIDWKRRLTHNQNQLARLSQVLSYQFDANGPISDQWEMSSDRQAAFSPSPVDFVKWMRQHDKLIFTLQPSTSTEGAYVFTYDLTGFNEVLKLLVQHCYK